MGICASTDEFQHMDAEGKTISISHQMHADLEKKFEMKLIDMVENHFNEKTDDDVRRLLVHVTARCEGLHDMIAKAELGYQSLHVALEKLHEAHETRVAAAHALDLAQQENDSTDAVVKKAEKKKKEREAKLAKIKAEGEGQHKDGEDVRASRDLGTAESELATATGASKAALEKVSMKQKDYEKAFKHWEVEKKEILRDGEASTQCFPTDDSPRRIVAAGVVQYFQAYVHLRTAQLQSLVDVLDAAKAIDPTLNALSGGKAGTAAGSPAATPEPAPTSAPVSDPAPEAPRQTSKTAEEDETANA